MQFRSGSGHSEQSMEIFQRAELFSKKIPRASLHYDAVC